MSSFLEYNFCYESCVNLGSIYFKYFRMRGSFSVQIISIIYGAHIVMN